MSRQSAAAEAPDVLRDSFLRYVAFTSDLGEACKTLVSRRLYLGSYAVVALYGVLDTCDKGWRAYHRATSTRQLPTLSSAIAASSIGAPRTVVPPAADLPLASLSTAAFRHSAANVAAACSACLPPAAASSISEQRSPVVPVAAAVLDTALWHSAASLAIPALAINRTVWAVGALLARSPQLLARHPRACQLAPSAAGLALLPLVVHHIDEAVTGLMDCHLRPHLPKEARLPASS